jgi:hypothetical protein
MTKPKHKAATPDPVWITNDPPTPVRVEGVEGALIQDEYGALVAISWVHHKIHEGVLYQVDTITLNLANDGTIIVGTPDPIGIEAHFTFVVDASGDCTVELIEGATPSGGSSKQARNLNRNHPDGINVTINPTLAGGTVISGPILVPGGSGPTASGGSGGTRPGLEWETDPTEHYAVRVTNIAGTAQDVGVVINFYED